MQSDSCTDFKKDASCSRGSWKPGSETHQLSFEPLGDALRSLQTREGEWFICGTTFSHWKLLAAGTETVRTASSVPSTVRHLALEVVLHGAEELALGGMGLRYLPRWQGGRGGS